MNITLRDDFDMAWVINQLDQIGGVSFPVLPPDYRQALLKEAQTFRYHEREKVVGPARVRQDLSGVDDFPAACPFFALRDAWQELLISKIADLPSCDSLFKTPLQFTELSLQRYEEESRGISPHLDAKSSINLICVFTLTGLCRFCICQDRQGTNAVELNAIPGNVIILRAPGFRHSDHRPFHFITDIQGPRISFGLRQRASS